MVRNKITSLMSGKYSDLPKNTVVINISTLDPFMWIYLNPGDMANSQLISIEAVYQADEDQVSIVTDDYQRMGQCWLRVSTEDIDKSIGKHIIKLTFSEKYTKNQFNLYASYVIQNDDPYKSYDYMNPNEAEKADPNYSTVTSVTKTVAGWAAEGDVQSIKGRFYIYSDYAVTQDGQLLCAIKIGDGITTINDLPFNLIPVTPEDVEYWNNKSDFSGKLEDLEGVSISDPRDGQVLMYDAETGDFINSEAAGLGDMLKSVYDTNNNGIVDSAETLEGLTASVEELNYLDGVTGPVQEQLNDKPNTSDLGTAASLDAPESGDASIDEVVIGSDTRLTNAREASDVSAWAKSATKPTYTASEVGAVAADDEMTLQQIDDYFAAVFGS